MDHDVDLVKDEAIATKYGCSICGQDLFESDTCDHWPGRIYLVNGEEMLCYILIKQRG